MVQLYKRKGAEVLVNTVTTGNQLTVNIAQLTGGGYVVVWTDQFGDASLSGIKAQRYDADGNKLGGEFLVNTTTSGAQVSSAIAGLPSGRFVVTWTDPSATGGDTSSNAVRGQLFEANGTPVGTEFLVNTATANGQSAPWITELSGGGFVISWTDLSLIGGDNSSSGIKLQLFDANGVKVGGEILANTDITGTQSASTLAALSGGGFVATWQTTGASSSSGVKFQLFDATGAKIGGEQTVIASADVLFTSAAPNVTPLAGGFVITWAQQDSFLAPGIPVTTDVHAQLYDTNGNKVGAEITVNTTTFNSQAAPDVDQLPGGGFIVTWQGPGTGTGGFNFNVYGQIFDASGNKVGAEFIVADPPGTQGNPEVEVLPSGDIVIVWTDNAGDGSGSSVWRQILTLTTDAPTDISLSASPITETAREGEGLVTLTTTGALNSTFTYEIVSDSTGGAFGIDGDKLVVLDNSLLDFETHPQVEVRIRTTDLNGHSYEETLTLDIADTPEGGYGPADGEFLVNTTTTGNQSEPALAALASGGFVATWTQWPTSGNGPNEGKGQLYDADGNKVGGELSLNDAQVVTALANGGFVIAGTAPDASQVGIIVTFYDAAGVATTAAIPVNTTTLNEQSLPSIAALSNGNVLVTWTDFTQSTFFSVTRAQILDSAGNKVGTEITVPFIPTGAASQVVALAGGGFVITWFDGSLQAALFTDTGLRNSPQFQVAEFGTAEPYIAALADGGFVVVWSGRVENSAVSDNDAIGAQIFDAHGNAVGEQILVSDFEQVEVASLDVAGLSWGGFVVTWAGNDNPDISPADAGIRAQVFDATGAALGDQLIVSTETLNAQIHPDVISLESGGFVIAWTDESGNGGDADGFAVKARIFSLGESAGPTEGPDVLNGTANDDTINGLGGNDIINGLGGNDVLIGGTGTDTMSGGTGDDYYFVDNAGDVVVEAAGEGNDRVFAGVSYVLGAGQSVEVMSTDFQAGTAAINLTGNELTNTIFGNAGDNILNGGGGADILLGLAGNDWYFIDNAGDAVFDGIGQGNDRVFAGVSYMLTPGAEVEVMSTDFQAGTAAINLTGNEQANTIFGNAGDNVLNGNAGADILLGLAGNDWYFIDNAGDAVFEAAGQGNDRVFASVSYMLTAGADVEVISTDFQAGTAAINLSGNELANTIFGNAGDNTLNGNVGADILLGLAGNDWYFVDNAGDQIFEAAGQGSDRVFASASYTLAAGVDVEVMSTDFTGGTSAINLTGNELANTIFGNDGANILDGKTGADTLIGFGGDDVYKVDNASDLVLESVGQGNDQVHASVSYTLAAGSSVESLLAELSAGAINLTGNELANNLSGNDDANILCGGLGNDLLAGFGGADSFLFNVAPGLANADTLFDFTSGIDKILLDHNVFTGLPLGVLDPSAFKVGPNLDADDRIIYSNEFLYFDADGSGPGQAVIFATTLGSVAMSASDFIVV